MSTHEPEETPMTLTNGDTRRLSHVYQMRTRMVEAIQWTGSNIDEIWDFAGGIAGIFAPNEWFETDTSLLGVVALDNEVLAADAGDWIIREAVRGRFRVMPDGEFQATYEWHGTIARESRVEE